MRPLFGGVLAITFLAPNPTRTGPGSAPAPTYVSQVWVCVCVHYLRAFRLHPWASKKGKFIVLSMVWGRVRCTGHRPEDRGWRPRTRARARVSLLTFKMPHNGHTGWSLSPSLSLSLSLIYTHRLHVTATSFGRICRDQSFGQSICNSDDFYGHSA